ncbi:unnamed protein product, partial [Lactuca virosa]
MEAIAVLCVLGVATIMGLYIWRISNWLWFKPKKIEKFLRDQGLRGNSYRFVFGDLKEMMQMTRGAKSKPMNLTHDIVPRVLPFIHKSIATHDHQGLLDGNIYAARQNSYISLFTTHNNCNNFTVIVS